MSYVVLGCLGFFFLYIFDFNKVFGWHKGLNICFAVGCGLLAVSTLGILFWSPGEVDSSVTSRLIFSLLAVVSLALLLYSLFFALPFDQTYLQINQANTVIDSGMYALCRHPGVIWFFCFYLFLWLASGKPIMMWAGIIWTTMDVIHVYVEDRWLFPKTLIGYENYKKKVPFLIPEINRIKQLVIHSN